MKTNLMVIAFLLFVCGTMAINLPVVFSQENKGVSTTEQVAVSTPEKSEVSALAESAVSALESVSVPAQEEAKALTNEISGEISLLDLEKSTLVIKHLKDEKAQEYEDVAFLISSSAAITKEALQDLTAGELVTIEYTTDADGNNIASNISVVSGEKESK